VLINTSNQIVGNTDIECPVSLAGEDINIGLAHVYGLDSRLRGNDVIDIYYCNFINSLFQ